MKKEVSRPRMIQRCFWRAYRRNSKGDIDESLISGGNRSWYERTRNHNESDDECESDVEWI